MEALQARFQIGQVIEHRLFGYRGVIFDVDSSFQGGEEWYERMARSRPPKDKPWYHVLVHLGSHTTYVSEQNMEPADPPEPIEHPLLNEFFSAFRDGRYVARRRSVM